MAETINILITAEDKASQPMKGVGKAAGDMDSSVRKSGGGFDALGNAAKAGAAVAIGAIASIAAAAGAFAASSISAAGTFEGAVNGLSAVAGTSLADAGFSLDDVSAKALQLGKDTQYSAQEAIVAMTELAKGGVSINSVMTDATDATLALAAAGGVNLANAAEIVAKQLGMWGDTGVTAADVADLVASAANASTVGVEDLALGLANVGGQARTSGVEFQDLLTGLATIAPGFTNAATAGTSMKTFLARMVPTTKAAKKAMIDLGLATADGQSKFFDAQGSFLGLEHAAELLQVSLDGMSEAQKSATLNTIFGQDAIAVADILARKGAEGYREMADSMGATGGAADVAAAKQQGFAFAMEQLKGSMETLQIVIGTKLLPILTPLIQQFTEGVNKVLTFVETFSKLAPALAESTNPIATFFNILRIATDDSLNPVIAKAQEFVTFVAGIGAMLAAGNISGAISAALSPIASTISTQTNLWVTRLGMWILDALPGLGANMATFAQSLYTAIGAALPGIVANLAIWAQRFSDWVVEALPMLLMQLGIYIASMIGFLIASFPAIVAQLGIWGAMFVSWLVDVVPKLIAAAGELLAVFLTWVNDSTPGLNATLALWQQQFVAWITEVTPKVIAELGKLWGELVAYLDELAGKAKADGTVGAAIIDGIKKGLREGLASVKEAAEEIAQAALSAAKSALGISSPSKVFEMQVGAQIGAGMVAGIMAGVSQVGAAGAALAGAALTGATGGGMGGMLTAGVPAVAAGGSASQTTNTVGAINVYPDRGMDEDKLVRKVFDKFKQAVGGRK